MNNAHSPSGATGVDASKRRLMSVARAQKSARPGPGSGAYARVYAFLQRWHRRFLRADAETGKVEIAFGPHRDRLVQGLQEALVESSIQYAMGGKLDQLRPRFHLRRRDMAATVKLLEDLTADSGVVALVRIPGKLTPLPLAELQGRLGDDAVARFDLWIQERTFSAATPVAGDGDYAVVEFDFWRDSANALRGFPYGEAPRPNDIVTGMRWVAFDRMVEPLSGHARTLGDSDKAPNLYGRDFPIDVVYTWVDDTDPQWLAEKARHTAAVKRGTGRHEGRADHPERFRNRDELKYSLRSLELFAPFVRRIYLVTMDQVPQWLDTSHPQIEVLSHREIYSDPSALPTFNSSSIETQLHHIEGLAEHFIYFNDDVFLGRPCSWRDFFLANGSMKFFHANHSISADAIDESAEEYLVADKNAIELFEKSLNFVVHKSMAHVPHPSRRSVLYEMEELFQSEFDACQRERFRSPNDLRPIAFMAPHMAFHTHRGVEGKIDQRYLALWKPTIDVQLASVLKGRRHKTFCINDAGVPPEREAMVDQLVADFLEAYFPHPSRFEKH